MTKKRDLNKPTEITLGGDKYKLLLDFTAAYDFEEAAGKGILRFLAPVFEAVREAATSGNPLDTRGLGMSVIGGLIERDALTAKDMATLLWACLGGEESGKTVREVGRLINIGNVSEVAMKLWEQVNVYLPKGSDDEQPQGESKNANTPVG